MQWALASDTDDTIPHTVNVLISDRMVRITETRIVIPTQNSIVQKFSAKSSRLMDVVTAAELNKTFSSAPNNKDMKTMDDAKRCVM